MEVQCRVSVREALCLSSSLSMPLQGSCTVYIATVLCGIPFMAANKGNEQAKGMIGNPFDHIERTRERRRPLEGSARRKGN